jgi:hypothetical protein
MKLNSPQIHPVVLCGPTMGDSLSSFAMCEIGQRLDQGARCFSWAHKVFPETELKSQA